jgi:hypothetical protein
MEGRRPLRSILIKLKFLMSQPILKKRHNVVPRKILNMLAEGVVNIVAPENGMESAAEAYEQ